MKATKTYRPEGDSVAGWDVKSKTQEQLMQWWLYGDNLKIDARSDAEGITMRMILRSRKFYVLAFKRPGRIELTATPNDGDTYHDHQ